MKSVEGPIQMITKKAPKHLLTLREFRRLEKQWLDTSGQLLFIKQQQKIIDDTHVAWKVVSVDL